MDFAWLMFETSDTYVTIFEVFDPWFETKINQEGWTDARSAVGFCLGSGLFGSYNSDERLLQNLEITW